MKLINSPQECGLRFKSRRCHHDQGPSLCDCSILFPKKCPLQDGQLIPMPIKEFIKLVNIERKRFKNLNKNINTTDK